MITDTKNLINKDELINKIRPFLKDYKSYLVGGYVRDALLGKSSLDRDLIIETTELEPLAKKISDFLGGYFIPLDRENNIYRIVMQDKINYLDLTCPLESNLEKDILRRDLTINAILFDLNKDEFIDITGGIEDLKNKKIKGICQKNFTDDPLRLLRIFRFYSTLGFKIDKKLIKIAKNHASKINESAKERINLELIKLFEGEYAHLALKEMDNTGLIDLLFPIMKEVKKIPNNSHHHLNLFEHSIETVKQIQLKYQETEKETQDYLDSKIIGTEKQIAYLKLAAFLHDIGKPSSWKIEEDTQRHRFIKHDDIGAKMVKDILKDLKFSKKQISYVQKMIKYHIYPSSLVCQENLNEKAKMRFFRKMDGYVIDIIILAMSDRLSAQGPAVTGEITTRNINNLKNLLHEYLEIKEKIKPLEKLLNGKEIMKLLDIKESPELGNIIAKLKEAQLSGEILTKEDAIKFVKSVT